MTAPSQDELVVEPSASFESVANIGDTGLTGVAGVRLIDNVGGDAIARVTAGVLEYPTGSGIYSAVLTAPPTVGQYTIVWDNGAATPGNVFTQSLVVSIVVPPPTPEPVSEDGPCVAWVTGEEVAACCGRADVGTFTSLLDDVAETSSAILFALSGNQFPGECSRTVRPCSTRCVCPWSDWSTWGSSWAWGGSHWVCGNQQCGCAPLSRVRLAGYPVREVTEVKIDGIALDPSDYRLDEHRYLTRMRDPAEPHVRNFWPGCQILDLDDDQEGTFSVTYTFGRDPTPDAVSAAAELGCQIFLSCQDGESGAECVLPSGVVRVQRQGVSFDLDAFRGWGRNAATGSWRTGMPLVDMFLSTRNPSGIRRGPAIWSPDVEPFARPVGSG